MSWDFLVVYALGLLKNYETKIGDTNEPSCPECGEPNPYFKNEVECADWHKPLGRLETAKKLSECPYCGGRELREVRTVK